VNPGLLSEQKRGAATKDIRAPIFVLTDSANHLSEIDDCLGLASTRLLTAPRMVTLSGDDHHLLFVLVETTNVDTGAVTLPGQSGLSYLLRESSSRQDSKKPQ
jgi:hypothetical protein